MRFEVDGPAFASEGDEVEIGDHIRRGDIVWFDRVTPHKLVMRVVTGPVSGQCYLIDQDSGPDVLRLVAVEPAPADPEPASATQPALRDTAYATELAHGSFTFPCGTEGRIERLRFKTGAEAGKEGIRFSWWKDGRMVPRPLDATEDQLLMLLADAFQQGVFTVRFVNVLRDFLGPAPDADPGRVSSS
jgi:hypothetical protein